MIPSRELPDILSQSVLGHPYDPQSTLPERFEIDFLQEQVENWEQGSNPTKNLLATFEQHNTGDFDLMQWMQGWVDQDVYEWPEEENPET